ncbi:hypothetical protein GV828_01355 [Flavobacterium sp. NST-5]|uniref:ATP/GTP-binding protein n=1 Tax=Flavobacterium ichthyis TaxID=2698827 RepID=A0ABW9Z9S5_9FLAO|nr:hypothetical protein [Flavobacterium ichthyis]NBL63840.1 hypothetical protein [Flavobacterium ichthyis]
MKKWFLIVFLNCFWGSFAQNEVVPFFKNTEKWSDGTFVNRDHFGNLYGIFGNEFRKIAPNSTLFYKNVALGKISRADLQNPLQIVLFYRNFTSVVLLDNQLNESLRINFSELETPLNPDAVGLAAQNRLWVFDLLTQKLGLYDLRKKSFVPLTPTFTEPLVFYQTEYNYFYWMDAKQRLYAADIFGKTASLGEIPVGKMYQVVNGKRVLYANDQGLFVFNLENGSISKVLEVEKSFDGFTYQDEILSIFTNQEIKNYNINLP